MYLVRRQLRYTIATECTEAHILDMRRRCAVTYTHGCCRQPQRLRVLLGPAPKRVGKTRMSLVGLRQHRKQTHPSSHPLCTLGFSAVIPSPKRAAKGIYNNCRLVTRGVLTARAYPDCQATTVAARGSDDADLRICRNIRITIFARRAHAP